MDQTIFESRRNYEQLDREALESHQLRRLNRLLEDVLPANRFYAEKLGKLEQPLDSLANLQDFPFTTKQDLFDPKSNPTYALNRTFDISKYVRFHRTSGTLGHPIVVLDTQEDWQWWLETWQYVLDAAGVTEQDRAALAFSYGPFIGFQSAHEALIHRNTMVIPCGGMSSLARLQLMVEHRATVLCCTPSYALHLTSVATEHQIEIDKSQITKIIVAGEPGGSIPSIRERIETAWQATLVDHAGATEIGPWGYDDGGQGLRIIESEFIAEFHSVATEKPAEDGELSELILTTLGRKGAPLIRYRTGDLVKPDRNVSAPNHFVRLPGGVLGRLDEMLIVRGVNIYPSAIEQILRSIPEVVEYRIIAKKKGELDALSVEVEDQLEEPTRIAQLLNLRLGLNVEVLCVPTGSLPRFEHKGKRFLDQRT
ncbi:MAG: phenylacetate--CoA ligase [Planctomycetaceae bacterium]|nr:phenylacetate--CoA ligase [Planctomycetaceae bacterium]